jgi:hypothetical protein
LVSLFCNIWQVWYEKLSKLIQIHSYRKLECSDVYGNLSTVLILNFLFWILFPNTCGEKHHFWLDIRLVVQLVLKLQRKDGKTKRSNP